MKSKLTISVFSAAALAMTCFVAEAKQSHANGNPGNSAADIGFHESELEQMKGLIVTSSKEISHVVLWVCAEASGYEVKYEGAALTPFLDEEGTMAFFPEATIGKILAVTAKSGTSTNTMWLVDDCSEAPSGEDPGGETPPAGEIPQ